MIPETDIFVMNAQACLKVLEVGHVLYFSGSFWFIDCKLVAFVSQFFFSIFLAKEKR